MDILLDTSVWVDHFRHGNPDLVGLVLRDQALTHPLVRLELACGTPPAPRAQTLADIALLRPAHEAALDEVTGFVERHRLHGLGCGAVDLSLLASACLTPGARLWTLDKRLAALAEDLDVGWLPAWH
jgi:predicted nucleic acid-binding protein